MPTRPIREMLERDRRVVRAAPEDTVHAAAQLMAENGCGSILVMEGERLLGIFTERDLLVRVVAAGLESARTKIRDIMSTDLETIRAEEPVAEAVRRMDEGGFRHLPVLDGDHVLGVVSARDIPVLVIGKMADELDRRHRLTERAW
jgi:CBS domain-containing protein